MLISPGNNRLLVIVILLYYVGNDIKNTLFICFRIYYILIYDKFMDIILSNNRLYISQ